MLLADGCRYGFELAAVLRLHELRVARLKIGWRVTAGQVRPAEPAEPGVRAA
jgi:hypothetical protein